MNINTNMYVEFYKGFNAVKSKRLNACIPIIKTYQNLAFPLSLTCCYEKTKEWFYSNFINTFSSFDANQRVLNVGYNVQFFEDDVYYINREKISIRTLDLFGKNISDVIIDLINEDKYICIYLDEFYIPFSSNFNYKHYEHEFFIIGYNLENMFFDCMSYGKDNMLKIRALNINDLTIAYNSKQLLRDLPVFLFSHYNELYHNNYMFECNYVFDSIKTYLSGENSLYYKKNIYNSKEGINNKYGVDTYINYITYINKVKEINEVQQKESLHIIPFYLLYEHKLCMLKRLFYLYQRQYIDSAISNHYKSIVDESQILLNNLIKYNIKESYDIKKLNDLLDKILNMISNLNEKEVIILNMLIK